jgi:hypothetical protein
LVLGTAVGLAGGGLGGGPVASAAVGQFDYARVRRLEPQTGQLTVAYGMSGLRDAHVAVAPAMRATASYRCRAPRQRPAVADVTVTAAIFRPEDQRDTVRQPDGTRAVEGELTVDPPPPREQVTSKELPEWNVPARTRLPEHPRRGHGSRRGAGRGGGRRSAR